MGLLPGLLVAALGLVAGLLFAIVIG